MKKIYIGSMSMILISITGINSTYATSRNTEYQNLPASGFNLENTRKEARIIKHTVDREQRISQQQEKRIQEKITTIHKKIAAHESLNRGEKKFADMHGVDYHY